MQTFTNKFKIAMNQDKTEVILNFYQSVPEPTTAMDKVHVIQNPERIDAPVANLVMTGQCARSLLSVLGDMLESDIK